MTIEKLQKARADFQLDIDRLFSAAGLPAPDQVIGSTSSYFFSDNDQTHLIVGTIIGFTVLEGKLQLSLSCLVGTFSMMPSFVILEFERRRKVWRYFGAGRNQDNAPRGLLTITPVSDVPPQQERWSSQKPRTFAELKEGDVSLVWVNAQPKLYILRNGKLYEAVFEDGTFLSTGEPVTLPDQQIFWSIGQQLTWHF